MATTFRELLKRLKTYDETYVLELLNIGSDTLVDTFEDLIEARQDYIRLQLADDYDEDPRTV